MDRSRERAGFYDSIYDSAISRDGISTEMLPNTIWGSFKSLFTGGKFSLILRVSLICAAFMIPIIIWATYMFMYLSGDIGQMLGITVPYSGNLGVPSVFVPDAVLIGNFRKFLGVLLQFSVSIPLLTFAALGVGIMFYYVRKIMWNEKFKFFQAFWDGFKATWLSSLIAGVLTSAAYFLVMVCFYVFDAYALSTAGKVFALIGSMLAFAAVFSFSAYLVSLSATYKMNLAELILSALKLTVGRWFPNLIMCIFVGALIVVVWVVSTFISSFMVLAYALLFAIGIYFAVAVCTVNTHRQFDRFINVEASGKNVVATTSVTYAKKSNDETDTAAEEAKKSKQPVKYSNPKKSKKKSESAPITHAEIAAKMPENVRAGENGLDDDLSVYVDLDEE